VPCAQNWSVYCIHNLALLFELFMNHILSTNTNAVYKVLYLHDVGLLGCFIYSHIIEFTHVKQADWYSQLELQVASTGPECSL
jgi:hypothetical protein